MLVTNDDGVDAPGIIALATALVGAGHEVVVVAPAGDCSGQSAAIGPLDRDRPIPLATIEWSALPGVAVHAIAAPPATAVYAACLGRFGEPFDVVASGINPGANTGHLVLHSGTVGAALTAGGLGVPAMAVSIVHATDAQYEWATAGILAAAALPWVVQPDGGPRVLNLNVPNQPLTAIRGVRDARLAPYGTVWTVDASSLEGHVQLDFRGNDIPPEPGTDRALLLDGYASVTPLQVLERADLHGAAGAMTAALAERARTEH